jgi:hypothetical protein
MKLTKGHLARALTLAAATSAIAVPASVASAATVGPVHGVVQVWVSPSNGGAPVNLTGAIGDAGLAVPTDSLGHVVHGSHPNADYRFLELTKGWILVNLTQFNKAANNPNATPTVFNKSNCSSVFSGKGPAQFVRGTGAYAGIYGTIELTFTFAGTAAKTANGTCNQSANPIGPGGGYSAIYGSGTVTLP